MSIRVREDDFDFDPNFIDGRPVRRFICLRCTHLTEGSKEMINSEAVRIKVESVIDAINAMKAQDLVKTATPTFVSDYNLTLAMAKEVAPRVDDKYWPPRLGSGSHGEEARYVEIEAYVRQIQEFVGSHS